MRSKVTHLLLDVSDLGGGCDAGDVLISWAHLQVVKGSPGQLLGCTATSGLQLSDHLRHMQARFPLAALRGQDGCGPSSPGLAAWTHQTRAWLTQALVVRRRCLGAFKALIPGGQSRLEAAMSYAGQPR